ncbi:MAG: hypothetical protein COY46_03455 [Chloroflexi bacterium CG_4_10_14_0_8_um_filter_46_9]|nr:MAG: hypothetical protein COY46_03455 [Chloroflexi bacterium CG_4_10_14_0_8_um_filter_46_9]
MVELREIPSPQSSSRNRILEVPVRRSNIFPCLGLLYCSSAGGILTLALSSQNAWQGVYLLLAYSLGLGLPFIAVGLALGALSPYLRWLNRHAYLTSIVSGALLIIIGILVLTGVLDYLAYYLSTL